MMSPHGSKNKNKKSLSCRTAKRKLLEVVYLLVSSKKPEESSPPRVFSAQLPLLLAEISNLFLYVVHLRAHVVNKPANTRENREYFAT